MSGLQFDRTRALAIGQTLMSALSAANPAVASVGAVLQALLEYRAMLAEIKANQPGLWAEISGDFNDDLRAWLDA